MKYTDKIQNLLPLGYLYLVILGILKETTSFYQIGINILKYSSIMDVLISPIATLTSHPIIFVTIASIFVFCYYLPSILYKHGHKKWIQKVFELKKTKIDLPDTEIKNYYLFISIKTLAVGLLSVYLGYGSAEGYFTSKRIKNNKLHYDYKLNYNTGESEDICLLESNSVYYFYVTEGDKTVKIAPISGIKNIELTKNKMLK
jgi:hypothetical protein